MDQRKDQLKYLKKDYKRERRRTVTPWKVLSLLGFLGAIVLAVAGAYPVYAETLVSVLPAAAAMNVTAKMLHIIRACVVVALAVGISAAIMWGNGKRKLKRSEAFLNWRTMREALRAEKVMK